MKIVLTDSMLPARLWCEEPISDEALGRICAQSEALHIEREPGGELLIRRLGGALSSMAGGKVLCQLGDWNEVDGRGEVYLNAGFLLGDGSMRGPRLAWVSKARLNPAPGEGDCFPSVCPEFVIELMSLSYKLPELQEKMRAWIANGVQLGWLIDPIRKAVEIYRPHQHPEVRENPGTVEGEGPVAGFVLELGRIWG
jgi:Uma2 family endonuclease